MGRSMPWLTASAMPHAVVACEALTPAKRRPVVRFRGPLYGSGRSLLGLAPRDHPCAARGCAFLAFESAHTPPGYHSAFVLRAASPLPRMDQRAACHPVRGHVQRRTNTAFGITDHRR